MSVVSIFRHGVVELGIMTLPLLVLFLIIGLASNIMQIGFMVSPEAVTPKLSKINPLTGFRNRFMSLKGLELLIKTLVIMTIIIWVSYRAIRREMPVYPPLMTADVGVIVLTIFHSTTRLLWDVLWIFVIIAAADYGFQK